ncbi:type VI secretion system Vgr family protein, partial [Psychrobacter celer]
MRTIAIHTPFGRALSFVELKGVEGLSSLYEYRLVLTSKNPNLAATDIIGQTIAVTIDTKGGERVLNGLVTDFGYLSEDEDEQSYHLYTCIMRPNMWYLTQRHDSRVFVDKDIIEITRTILDEFGFPYEIRCTQGYRKYGHSTQYQETSFNYLNRLFEQEGLYYYFEHTEGNNTLIIVDDNSAHEPIQGRATISYHSAVTPGTPDKNYIDIWQQSDRLATKKIKVNDHSYKLSNRKLDHNMSTHALGGITTEHYDFYTGFSTKDDAASYAQVRSQDYNAQSKRVNAAGNVLTIAPGHSFKLSRHPHDAANTEHLIIHAEYDFKEAGYASGSEQSHYRISFTAIPLSYQYRTPRVTPKPQIIGTQGATVTGPAGEEVHTNSYGDIKVQFHWDRYGPKNQKSSDWIRVAQGSAGGSFGSINTPRIGEEVLIDFINGDSDRPIVIGRLYNSANPPPWGYP